jgi:hypothetical protein
MDGKTRNEALKLIWRHTHRDLRGVYEGTKCVLTLRLGGTCSVPLAGLTDEEITSKLEYATHAEAKRLAAKAAKV